jgi:hypothetical protein
MEKAGGGFRQGPDCFLFALRDDFMQQWGGLSGVHIRTPTSSKSYFFKEELLLSSLKI